LISPAYQVGMAGVVNSEPMNPALRQAATQMTSLMTLVAILLIGIN